MFDVQEGDLFLHEIEFEYNVPAGMCDYLSFYTHWHYNQKSGIGPTKVFENECFSGERVSKWCEKNGDDNYNCNNTEKYGKCVDLADSFESISVFCDTVSPPIKEPKCDSPEFANCRSRSDATFQHIAFCDQKSSTYRYEVKCYEEEETKFCLESLAKKPCGDDSYSECKDKAENLCEYKQEDGENCCLGEYIVGEKKSSWGGDLRQCIGGLGRISWDSYTADGRPAGKLSSAISGLRADYQIPALIDVLQTKMKLNPKTNMPVLRHRRNSFVIANHWEGIENESSELPGFYKSVNDDVPPGHRALSDGYPYITLGCQDKGREVKYRIHLIIREWNTKGEFREFKSGGTGDPDVAEKEGSDCDYYEQEDDNIDDVYRRGEGAGEECNDMVDADDWVATAEDTEETHPNLEYK